MVPSDRLSLFCDVLFTLLSTLKSESSLLVKAFISSWFYSIPYKGVYIMTSYVFHFYLQVVIKESTFTSYTIPDELGDVDGGGREGSFRKEKLSGNELDSSSSGGINRGSKKKKKVQSLNNAKKMPVEELKVLSSTSCRLSPHLIILSLLSVITSL